MEQYVIAVEMIVTGEMLKLWPPPHLLLHQNKIIATVANLIGIVLPMEMEMGILFFVKNSNRDVIRNKWVIFAGKIQKLKYFLIHVDLHSKEVTQSLENGFA